jgi:hypothetical protein
VVGELLEASFRPQLELHRRNAQVFAHRLTPP